MESKSSSLPIESVDFFVPELKELGSIIEGALRANFESAVVEVVDCPDLSQPPFHLAAQGLCGDAAIVDLGGVPNLIPIAQRDKIYNLVDMPALIGFKDSPILMIGAGAGPWPHLGTNCEMMTNLAINGEQRNHSRLASVVGNKTESPNRQLHTLPQDQTKCALLCNFLITRGRMGLPVLRVKCSKRTGPDNLISCMRKAIHHHYPDQFIGLGGTFMIAEGRAKLHIMPDFSPCPLLSDDDVNNWLHFYDASAPLIGLSVFVSHDPGLDLRVEHSHCFSLHGEGGHYHEDVTPETVEYVGYFTPALKMHRIDRPLQTHNIGRD